MRQDQQTLVPPPPAYQPAYPELQQFPDLATTVPTTAPSFDFMFDEEPKQQQVQPDTNFDFMFDEAPQEKPQEPKKTKQAEPLAPAAPQTTTLAPKQPIQGAVQKTGPKKEPHVVTPVEQSAREVGKAVKRGYGEAIKVPIVGEALRSAVEGTQGVIKDYSKDPATAAAATALGAPGGVIGLIEDLYNVAGPAALRLASPATGGATTPKKLPLMRTREEYYNNPIVKPVVEKAPSARGLGELVGPALVGPHVPLPLKPGLVKGTLQGAVTGEAYGALGAAGAEAKEGRSLSLKKALREGAPAAVIGGTLGAALGRGKPPEGPPPSPPGFNPDHVTLPDGNVVTRKVAGEILNDPNVHEEAKAQVLDALAKHDEHIANGTTPETPETTKPQELAAYPEGDVPGLRKAALQNIEQATNLDELQTTVSDATKAISKDIKGPALVDVKKEIQAAYDKKKASFVPAPEAPKSTPIQNPRAPGRDAINWYIEETAGKQPAETESPRDRDARISKTQEYNDIYTSLANAHPDWGVTKLAKEAYKLYDSTYGEAPAAKPSPEAVQAEVDRMRREQSQNQGRRAIEQPNEALQRYDQRTALRARQAAMKERALAFVQNQAPAEQVSRPPEQPTNQLALAPDVPISEPQASHQPPVAEAIPSTAEQISSQPETVSGEIPAPTEAPAEPQPRYIARKSEKGGGYHEIVDTETNAVQSNSKRSLSQAQATADKLNSGALRPTQGQRDVFTPEVKPASLTRQNIVGSGEAPPAHLNELANRFANEKHDFDLANAEYEAASLAFKQKHGIPLQYKTDKLLPEFDAEKEAADYLAAPGESQMTATGLAEYGGTYKFRDNTSIDADAKTVLDLYSKKKGLEDAMKATKGELKSQFPGQAATGEAPRSFTIPHEKGPINIRMRPGNAYDNGVATEQVVSHNINQIKSILKGGQKKTKEAYDKATAETTSPDSLLGKFITEEGGYGYPGIFDPTQWMKKDSPVAASLAEGERQIPDWQNTADKVASIFTLRRALDYVKDESTDLHNQLWEGIAKETILGRGLKFKPEHADILDKSLSMDPNAIRTGKELGDLDYTTRDYLATRRAIRQANAKKLQGVLDKYDKQYGEPQNMPKQARTRYEVMRQMRDALQGRTMQEGTSEFSELGGLLSKAMYDYVFKWNAAYHALNLFDPIVVGSSRAGIQRIVVAKALLAGDKNVKSYISGIGQRSPLDQLRYESAGSQALAKGVKGTAFTKALRLSSKIHDVLPDLPSERWNFEDSLVAGLILHGDKAKYPGGGVKYVRDLASGKLGLEEQVKGFVEGLQVANDVTGAGSLGLDKDPIQRTKGLKYVIQFTSQQYRVARLLHQWAREGNIPAILTFSALTTAISGRGALPAETDLLELNPTTRELLYKTQDFLDQANVVSKIPVVGRDLADKMRTAVFVPILGGSRTNLLMDKLTSTVHDLAEKKPQKVWSSAFLMALSGVLGGGGLQADKSMRVADNAKAGKKTFYANRQLIGEVPGARPIGKATRDYNSSEALKDALLPGKAPEESKFILQQRREFARKR